MKVIPRFLRFRDAPGYLGMDRNRFNAEVRPRLTEIPIGVQGIAFDRLELDAWAEEHMARNGRPAQAKGALIWDASKRQASANAAGSGMSTSASTDGEFARALKRLASKKPGGSSRGARRRCGKQGSTE